MYTYGELFTHLNVRFEFEDLVAFMKLILLFVAGLFVDSVPISLVFMKEWDRLLEEPPPAVRRELPSTFNIPFEFLKLMFPVLCMLIVSFVLSGPKFVKSYEVAVRKLAFLLAILSTPSPVLMEHAVLHMG